MFAKRSAALLAVALIAGPLPFVPSASVEAASPSDAGELLLFHRTEFATGFADLVTGFGDQLTGTLDGYGGDVPLIGDKLTAVGNRISEPFDGVSTNVRNTVEDALFNAEANGDNPLDVARGALYVALGPGPSGLDDVDPAVRTALMPLLPVIGDGLGILADRDGDLSITPADVGVISSLGGGLGGVGGTEPEVEFAVDLADTFTVSVPFSLGLAFDPNVLAPDLGPFVDVLTDGTLDVKSSVQVDAGWTANLRFGVSEADGFYIPTATDPEIALGVFGSVPNLNIDTTLGLFGVNLTDGTPEAGVIEHSTVRLAYTWQFTPAVGASGANRMLAARPVPIAKDASGKVRIAVRPRVDLPITNVGGIDISLPEISFDLEAEANRNNGAFETDSIRFDDMTLGVRKLLAGVGASFGQFTEHALGPIAKFDDALNARIPGISDVLNERVTLNSALPAEARSLLDEVNKLTDLGSLFRQAAAAGPATFNFGCVDVENTLPQSPFNDKFGPCLGKGQNLQYTSSVESGVVKIDAFRLVNVVKLLAGEPSPLVSVGLPKVDKRGSADFGFSKSYFSFNVKANLDVDSDLRLVYDTEGLNKAIALVRAGQQPDVSVLFDGMHVRNNASGHEFGVEAGFTGGQSLRTKKWGVTVFSASANLDVNTSLGFELVDPDRNGKLTYAEMSAISNGFSQPQRLLCVFDFESEQSAKVSASANVAGVGGSIDLGWPGSPIRLQDLLSGVSGCPGIIRSVTSGNQILATAVRVNGDNWLRLNVGAFSEARRFGDTDDSAGATVSARMSGDDVIVRFKGAEQTFTGPFAGVVALGGDGPDNLQLGAITLPISAGGGAGDDTIVGGSADDTLEGGEGNDDITGAGGDDRIDGDDGNDTLRGQTGDDTIDGGRGIDDITGAGGDDRLRGGDGDDRLSAGPGDDDLAGGPGDDRLNAAAGNDALSGGTGNDTLIGGDGIDVLKGGTGNDVMKGDAGTDRLDGGPGNDNLDGGANDDIVSGGDDDDQVSGGNGADVVRGGDGDDILFGGDGNDELSGGLGNDRGAAGAGADTINAGAGDDAISGGDGPDTMLGGPGNDELAGGAGIDILRGDIGNDTLDGGADDDVITGAEGDDTIIGGTGNDTVTGDDGDDNIKGGDDNDDIDGGLGDDFIAGGAGNDSINGRTGNDDLRGDAGDDVLLAEDGADLVIGGDGDDLLVGGDGPDRLIGLNGNDTIDGGLDADEIFGGTGDDTIMGGSGENDIEAGSGNDVVIGGSDDDTIDAGPGDDIVDARGGNDTVLGSSGDDTLTGGTGNDSLTGGADEDSHIGGPGVDLLTGDIDDTWLEAGGQAGDRIIIDALQSSADDEMHVGQGQVWGLSDERIVFLGVERLEMKIDGDDAIWIDGPSLPVDIQSFGAELTIFETSQPIDVTGSPLVGGDVVIVHPPFTTNGVDATLDAGLLSNYAEAPITYGDIEELRLVGSRSSDRIGVAAADVTTTMDLKSGNDIVEVRLPAAIEGLVASGGAGIDRAVITIDGDPSTVTGLSNTGFAGFEDLRVDNGAGTVSTDWKFTDGAVLADTNALLASVAGIQTVTYLPGSGSADDLDVVDSSSSPQTVLVGDDQVLITEGSDIVEFKEFVPTGGVYSTITPNNQTFFAVDPRTGDTDSAAAGSGALGPFTTSAGWRESVSEGSVGEFGTGIEPAFGELVTIGRQPPTIGDNISSDSAGLFARGDVVAADDTYVIVGDTGTNMVTAFDDNYDLAEASFSSTAVDGEVPQTGSVSDVATDGEWIFVGDATNQQVRNYTFDGRQSTTTAQMSPTATNGDGTQVVPWTGPFETTGTTDFDTDTSSTYPDFIRLFDGSTITRPVTATRLPVTKVSFHNSANCFLSTDSSGTTTEEMLRNSRREIYDGYYEFFLYPDDGGPKVKVKEWGFYDDFCDGSGFDSFVPEVPVRANRIEIAWTQTSGFDTNRLPFHVILRALQLEFGTGGANLRSTITSTEVGFGAQVSADDGVLVVGAPGANGGVGSVSAFTNDDGDNDWEASGVIGGLTGDVGFGGVLDIDNGRVAVGIPEHSDGTNAIGRAAVLQHTPGILTPVASLTASTANAGDRFGASVAIQDGVGIAVGAPGVELISSNEGTAFVASEIDGFDTLSALPTSGAQAGAGCGSAVGITRTSIFDAVAVGCSLRDTGVGGTDAGIVRRFRDAGPGAEAIASTTTLGGAVRANLYVIAQPDFDRVTLIDDFGVISTATVPGLESFEGRDLLAAGNSHFFTGSGTTLSAGDIDASSLGAVTSTTLAMPIAGIATNEVANTVYVITTDGTLRWYDSDLNELGSIATAVTGPRVAEFTGGMLFLGGADAVAAYDISAVTPTFDNQIGDGANGARGISDIRGIGSTGTYLFVASESGDRLGVLERVGGVFVFRQQLNNFANGVSGLNGPVDITVRGNDVFVGSVGSTALDRGVARFGPPAVVPPSNRFDVRLGDGTESLSVTSGPGNDAYNIRDIGRPLTVSTADGSDFVNAAFVTAGQQFDLDTGDGQDSVVLRATGVNGVMTMSSGEDDDDVTIFAASVGASTSVDLGTGNDNIRVAGDHLDSTPTITPSLDPGDTLYFSSSVAPTPAPPTVGTGSIQHPSHQPLDYVGIESIILLSPPVAQTSGVTTVEGGGVSFDTSASIVPAGSTGTWSWDIDGDGVVGDIDGENLSLTWAQLQSFGLGDDGVYPITLRLTTAIGVDQITVPLTITNVAPSVSFTPPGFALEGRPANFGFSISDPGADSLETWVVDWGDGTIEEIVGIPDFRPSHIYAQDGVPGDRVVNVRLLSVSDEDGTYPQTISFPLTVVNNTPPSISISGATSIDEGAIYTLSVTEVGSGLDGIPNVRVDWGDGAVEDIPIPASRPTVTFTHEFDGPVQAEISVVAVGFQDAIVSDNTITVDVAGVDPTLTLTGPSTASEGDYTLGLSAADPGRDTVTHWEIDWGDGSPVRTVVGATPTATHSFDGPAAPVVTARAFDEDGSYTASKALTITNVAPVIDSATTSAGVVEGRATEIVAMVTDVDTVTYELRSSSGTVLASNQSGNFSQIVPDDGPFGFTIVVTDDDGASDTATVAGTAANEVPGVELSTPATVAEGDPVAAALAVSDVGADIATSASIDWGDGPQTVALTNGAALLSHVYPDGSTSGQLTVISVTDEDGTHAVGSSGGGVVSDIAVTDVDPIFEIVAADTVTAGSVFDLATTLITDPGTDVVSSVDIDWGDGTIEPLILSAGAASGQHAYADTVDVATISVTVTNEDGTHPAITHEVDVQRAPVADDDTETLAEDTTVIVDVLDGDTDADDDIVARSVIVTTVPGFGAAYAEDGAVTYIPATNFDGADSLTYQVCDAGGLCDTATVGFTVTPEPDAPQTEPDAVSLTESAVATVDVLDNDNDPDIAPPISPATDPKTLVVQSVDVGTTGLTATVVDNAIAVDTAGAFESLAAGTSIERTLTYSVANSVGSSTADLVVTITGENDAPVARADAITVGAAGPVAVDVLGNDTDIDRGDAITITALSATSAPLTISADGATLKFDPGAAYIELAEGETTDVVVEYTIEDSSGASAAAGLTLTVSGDDQAPVVAGTGGTELEFTLDEDETLRFEPDDLVSDPDGESVMLTNFDSVTSAGGTVVEGSLIYTPVPDFNGVDDFTFTMQGAGGASARFTVALIVVAQPDAPRVMVGGSAVSAARIEVVADATPTPLTIVDPEGDPFTITVTRGALPSGLTLNDDGTFSGTPASTGTTEVTLDICDDTEQCNEVRLTVDVLVPVVPSVGLPQTGTTVRLVLGLAGYVAAIGLLLLAISRRRRSSQMTST